MQSKNSELDYLNELISDFPPRKIISVEKSFELLRTRYEQLEKSIPLFLNLLENNSPSTKLFPFRALLLKDDNFPAHFYILCRKFHLFLFAGIVNNAGKFRQLKDPKSGVIGFGGYNRRMAGNFKYTGCNPINIETELCDSFLHLRKNSPDTLKSAMKFYRKFVKIHPFYDANGRIARLIISIYLLKFNYYINWRSLETRGNKTKFIKKLNACHIRENKPGYSEYFGYLVTFFRKFVISLDQLDREDQSK